MASGVAIRVAGVGKRYRLGELGRRMSLRECLGKCTPRRLWGKRPAPEARRVGPAERPTLWALQDVNFDIRRGEVVGFVGRNGAGKSTLLKILSRITVPTTGRIEIRGRISSLLEVGTGFHPELTGRENIYLNGAILGMTRAEIRRKFDEIVEFSGVEKFIDTPVKRYSSGMGVRLGFAVAAHLEPEILIVDEVLAVGDVAFQKKCLGKMGSVARGGRTVLFVSHNMHAVNLLCSRAVLLEQGRVAMAGKTQEVVDEYLRLADDTPADAAEVRWELDRAPGDEATRLVAVRVLDEHGMPARDHAMEQPVTLEMEFCVLRPGIEISTSFHVYNHQDVCLFAVADFQAADWQARPYPPGRYRSRCRIPAHLLNEGLHRVSAFVVQSRKDFPASKDKVISFCVHDRGTRRGGYTGSWIGAVRPVLPWDTQCLGSLP